jgi:hypothetical protein
MAKTNKLLVKQKVGDTGLLCLHLTDDVISEPCVEFYRLSYFEKGIDPVARKIVYRIKNSERFTSLGAATLAFSARAKQEDGGISTQTQYKAYTPKPLDDTPAKYNIAANRRPRIESRIIEHLTAQKSFGAKLDDIMALFNDQTDKKKISETVHTLQTRREIIFMGGYFLARTW